MNNNLPPYSPPPIPAPGAQRTLPVRPPKRRQPRSMRPSNTKLYVLFLINTILIGGVLYALHTNWWELYSLEELAAVSVGVSSMMLVLTVLLNGKFLSFHSMYYAATFLFLSSVPMLYLYEGTRAFDSWFLYRFEVWEASDQHAVGKMFLANLLAFSGLSLGSLIPKPLQLPRFTTRYFQAKIQPWYYHLVIHRMALGSLALGFLIVGYRTYQGRGIEQFFTESYKEAYGTVSGVLSYAIQYFLFWGISFYTLSCPTLRSLKRNLPIIGLLALSPLAIGDRSGSFTLLAFIAAYYSMLSGHTLRVEWKRALLLGLLIGFLTPYIQKARQNPQEYYQFSAETESSDIPYTDRLSSTDVSELSSTHQVLEAFIHPSVVGVATLRYYPEEADFRMGRDYVYSLHAALPFGEKLTNALVPQFNRSLPNLWFKINFSATPRVGSGFLQAYEAYRNFGYLGILVSSMMLGALLTYLWHICCLAQTHPSTRLYCLFVFLGCMLWVRNTATTVIKQSSFGYILAFIIPTALFLLFPVGKVSQGKTGRHPAQPASSPMPPKPRPPRRR